MGIGVVIVTTSPEGCEAVADGVVVKYGLSVFGLDAEFEPFELQAVISIKHKTMIFRMR